MYRLHACLFVLALGACGRLSFDPVAVDVDGSVGVDATSFDAASVDAAGPDAAAPDAGPPVLMPIFYLDAADHDGTGNPGVVDCPAIGASTWVDLVSDTSGPLSNFSTPPCGFNGWVGDGSDTEPHRLHFVASAEPSVSFGTIGHASKYTIEAWIRYTGKGDASGTGTDGVRMAPIVAKGAAEAEDPLVDVNYALGIAETGEPAFDFEDNQTSDNHPLVANADLSTDVWHHLAATHDHKEVRLYLDGDLIAERPETAMPSVATSSILAVGAAFESDGTPRGAAFDGDIAIVRIFDRALSPTELLAECNAFAGRFNMVCQPSVSP